jgi:hypothetical protein
MNLAIMLFLVSALLYTYAVYAPRRTEPRFGGWLVRKPRRSAASSKGVVSQPWPDPKLAASPRVARRARAPFSPWRKPSEEKLDGVALLQAAWRGDDAAGPPPAAAQDIDGTGLIEAYSVDERDVDVDSESAPASSEAIAWVRLVDDSRTIATQEERLEIVRSLGVIENEWCASILEDVLRTEPDPAVRYGALKAIAAAKYATSVFVIAERSLSAADVAERELALEVLIALDAIEPLNLALDDPEDRIARAAAVAVCRALSSAEAIDAHLGEYVTDGARRETLLTAVLAARRPDAGEAESVGSADAKEDNVA